MTMNWYVDPASETFTRLSRQEQAKLYLGMGWTKEAVADEVGVCMDMLNLWLNPERYQRKLARTAAAKRAKRAASKSHQEAVR